MMKVEICGATYEELKEQVANLAISMGIGGFDVPAPEPKKQTKAKKEKEAVSLPNHEAPAAPTLDAASAALKKLHEVKGLPVAREVLTSVGANRMSEVSPDKYAAVIEACEKLLA